jgi:hypothetical protein
VYLETKIESNRKKAQMNLIRVSARKIKYFIVATALLIAGTPLLPATVVATPVSAPSAGPRYVSWANFGNGSFSVAWRPPLTNTGAPITGYLIEATAGLEAKTCETSDTVFFCSITGLTNGTAYSVKAYSLAGSNRSPSTNYYVTTPSDRRPTEATNVVASEDGTSALVTWTNPSTWGSIGERDKRVDVYAFEKGVPVSNGVGTSAPVCQLPTGGTSCRFDDALLSDGKTYNFVVKAFNANAGSRLSDPSSDFVMPSPPDQLQTAPSLVGSTTGTSPYVTLSWNRWGEVGAPSYNHGAITSYKVMVWGVEYTYTPVEAGCSGVSTTCSVTFDNTGTLGTNAGVAYGKYYRPVVLAINGAGSSLYSYQPLPVFPGYAPSQPVSAISVRTSTSLNLRWTFSNTSSNNGGWQVDHYDVNLYDDGNNLIDTFSAPKNVRTWTKAGLATGKSYYFTVRAVAVNGSTSSLETSSTLALP